MKHKRHIVLAALVLALGTAVYINWRYGAENIHPASASTAASGTVSSARLGDVLYVNGGVASPDGSAEASAVPSAQFTEAALSRQKARDEATALLKATLTAAESSEEARKAAVAQAAKLAEHIEQESKIESLLKAKGYANCLAFLDQERASVLVQSDGLQAYETITIQDIVHNQSGVAYENIVIVEVK